MRGFMWREQDGGKKKVFVGLSPVGAGNVALALNTGGAGGVHHNAGVGFEAIVEDAVAFLHVLAAEGLGVPEILGPGDGEGQKAGEDSL